MKNILLILAIAYSSASFAQGNLQFNQVLNFDYSSVFVSGYGNVSLETITVPIGKVWKITAASSHGTTFNGIDVSALAVNSHFLWFQPNSSSFIMNTPFWLSSGVHEFKVFNQYGSGQAISSAISVIEFNIVP